MPDPHIVPRQVETEGVLSFLSRRSSYELSRLCNEETTRASLREALRAGVPRIDANDFTNSFSLRGFRKNSNVRKICIAADCIIHK
jgi:hypothetical protein